MSVNPDFAAHCCDLLSSLGHCTPKRMFGGYGISVDGLTVALLADLGAGDQLWLKASDDTLAQFEAAGCKPFTYTVTKNGQARISVLKFYAAPEEAMDAPHAMAPWARLALQAALVAQNVKAVKKVTGSKVLKAKPNRKVNSSAKTKS